MGFVKQEVANFIGSGVTLPIVLQNGRWPISSGSDLIKESIKLILRWPMGIRPFLCEFGSKLEDILEEPNDDVLRQIVYAVVNDQLLRWEKRVELRGIELTRKDFATVNITVVYMVISSQKLDTFTFPFYSQITS